VIGAS
jgi:hypothetical protein